MNDNSTGTHVIIDIYNIKNKEILKFSPSIIDIMDMIIEEFNLNVVEKAIHQFKPFGATGVYVLSESHLSIHTYVEEGKMAMDLYTCKDFTETNKLTKLLKEDVFKNDCEITIRRILR